MSDGYDEFISRLDRDGIAKRSDLLGCTSAEIAALESTYGLKLPNSYRRFLELMGHASHRLFRYDHFAASYEHVLRMTKEEREYAAEDGELQSLDDILTESSLIVLERLGEQFFFIRCERSDDSVVHYYNNSTWQSRPAYGGVLDYLSAIADECAEAVRGGYFRD